VVKKLTLHKKMLISAKMKTERYEELVFALRKLRYDREAQADPLTTIETLTPYSRRIVIEQLCTCAGIGQNEAIELEQMIRQEAVLRHERTTRNLLDHFHAGKSTLGK
jgi:hypothetical protein